MSAATAASGHVNVEELISVKRDGGVWSGPNIDAFVDAVAYGQVDPVAVGAWLMAVYVRGLSVEETAVLTKAMTAAGDTIDRSAYERVCVDKHSTGGVGDATSFIVAPVLAACGAGVPMISGRALGHTGGTLDKFESVPGVSTSLTASQLVRQVNTVGAVIAGQTGNIAPVDAVLYRARSLCATVDHVGLITASIMSKKLAEGVSGLVLDVKTGDGALMRSVDSASTLATSLTRTGIAAGVRTTAVVTNMGTPLAWHVGNRGEVGEAVAVLTGRGRFRPALKQLSCLLASHGLVNAGVADTLEQAEHRVDRVLADGSAAEVFARMVAAQGGPGELLERTGDVLAVGNREAVVRASSDGVVSAVSALTVAHAWKALCRNGDLSDPVADIELFVEPGTQVCAGDVVAVARSSGDPESGAGLLRDAVSVSAETARLDPLVFSVHRT